MAKEFKIIGFTSSAVAKRLSGNYYKPGLDASAAWYDSNTVLASVNDTLSESTREVVIVEGQGAYIDLKFSADNDPGAVDGQGYRIWDQCGYEKISITAKSGTVYVLRANDLVISDSKEDAYTDSKKEAATTNMEVYPGDGIVCDKNGSFTIRFQTEKSSKPFYVLPIVSLTLKTYFY